MKYIGTISKIDVQSGYGFISCDQRASEGYSQDIFFRLSECSFLPRCSKFVIFDLEDFYGKPKAVNVKSPGEEIEYLIEHWGSYSKPDQQICVNAFRQAYRQNGPGREKLIEVAKKNIEINDVRLSKVISLIAEENARDDDSIVESAEIDRAHFVAECKQIIVETVAPIIQNRCDSFDFSFSKDVPTVDEVYSAVSAFIAHEEPRIVYTHTIEDGYWRTYYKWDGSEDSWIDGDESSSFHAEHVFALKSICIHLPYNCSGSNDTDKDLQSKLTRVIEVNQLLKNRRLLCNHIDGGCKRTSEALLTRFINEMTGQIEGPLATALNTYLTSHFPVFGPLMNGCLFKTGLSDSSYMIEADRNYWKSAGGSPDFDIKKIQGNLNDIRRFIYATVSQIVNDNYQAKHIDVNICSHPSDAQEQNGLLLSSDGSVLYSVTDTDVEALVIPASVSAVGDGAFMGCTRLRSVRFLGGLTKIGHGVFTNDMLIEGDFSHLSYIGYNSSASAISIGDQTKPILDWAYMFNKDEIDSIEIKVDIVHIEH